MKDIKKLTKLALFSAIIMMLGLTPLGFIMIGGAGITMVHIPVILGSYIFNLKQSCYLGFIFGLASFIRCFTTPDGISMIVLGTSTGFGLYNLFLLIMIIFLPRILVGCFANISYKSIYKLTKKDTVAMPISAFIGSMTNTIFVLSGLYLFAFGEAAIGFGLQDATPKSFLLLLLGVVCSNGLIEAVVALVVSTPVGLAIKKINKNI